MSAVAVQRQEMRTGSNNILMLDPSELYRPEINKKIEQFREFSEDKVSENIVNGYR